MFQRPCSRPSSVCVGGCPSDRRWPWRSRLRAVRTIRRRPSRPRPACPRSPRSPRWPRRGPASSRRGCRRARTRERRDAATRVHVARVLPLAAVTTQAARCCSGRVLTSPRSHVVELRAHAIPRRRLRARRLGPVRRLPGDMLLPSPSRGRGCNTGRAGMRHRSGSGMAGSEAHRVQIGAATMRSSSSYAREPVCNTTPATNRSPS